MAAIEWISRRPVGGAFGMAAVVVTLGNALALAQPVMTEATALGRAYGAGVHAYFSGDAQRAYDDLTQAIEAGTSDPRAWYFRGLAALKLGRLDESEADFSTAATRETEAAGDWDVSRSLERVQGRDRLALERYRVRARVAGLEKRRQAAQRRYSDIESRQSEVLRERRPDRAAPDAPNQFGAEEVSATPVIPPPTSGEGVGQPEASDGIRETPAAPGAGEAADPGAGEAADPAAEAPMEDTDPESTVEARAEATPVAEATSDGGAVTDVEKPAAEAEDPADPAAPGDAADAAMDDKAEDDKAEDDKAEEAGAGSTDAAGGDVSDE